MSNDWIIRNFIDADRDALADIYLTRRRDTFHWIAATSFRLEDFTSQTEGELILVAEAHGGEIAGFISLWEPDCFIHMLYIDKEWQGRGAGTALLRALPGWSSNTYCLKCLVQNKRAKGFYLKHGFKVTGTGGSPEGEYEVLTISRSEGVL
ncbi:GNAT family N-acetyltransferase [Shinella sp. BE166]|uniref:GNAT family N-acetyltransferase n=1 Tax=unclassified Shinella TaxID=2643062 RepID=UPI003EB71590